MTSKKKAMYILVSISPGIGVNENKGSELVSEPIFQGMIVGVGRQLLRVGMVNPSAYPKKW